MKRGYLEILTFYASMYAVLICAMQRDEEKAMPDQRFRHKHATRTRPSQSGGRPSRRAPSRSVQATRSQLCYALAWLGQGTTIGPLIRWVSPAHAAGHDSWHLTEPQAWARLEAAQLAAIQPLVHGSDGSVIHPRLLEQYSYRARITATYQNEAAFPADDRAAHYDVVLAAIAAGRVELLRMHRSGLIGDEILTVLEHDLDLQEIAAQHGHG